MSNSSQEIVYEGWLTKSPPSKRIWRAKWRRRWFALRQSGELPGQYYLDYYSDRNCRKLKGRIDLDLCDQVDAGLHMERGGPVLGSRVRGSVFSVRTAARTYHLEADCEADMEKWVDAICRACGLRADQPSPPTFNMGDDITSTAQPSAHEPDLSEPYIRISECITGERDQNPARPRAYTFDAQNMMVECHHKRRTGSPTGVAVLGAVSAPDGGARTLSDNESEKRPSIDASRPISGPAVPPRPPKTFRLVKDGTHRERERVYLGSDPVKYTTGREMPSMSYYTRNGSRSCYANATCHVRHASHPGHVLRMPSYEDDFPMEEEEGSPSYSPPTERQYWNIPRMPPTVDRALKPRHSGYGYHSSTHHLYNGSQVGCGGDCKWSPSARRRVEYRNTTFAQVHRSARRAEKSDTLQYLDLDLEPKPSCSKDFPGPSASHSKSKSATEDPDSAYKTVDFLKTEAFNITRKDAEAHRSNAMALSN